MVEKFLREVVKAEQQIPIDFTLEAYADDRKNYEASVKKNARAGDGTTVSYTAIPANNRKRRLAEEGFSKANWIIAFDDCNDVNERINFIASEPFLASVIADIGIQVSLPIARLDEAEMPAQEKKCGGKLAHILTSVLS